MRDHIQNEKAAYFRGGLSNFHKLISTTPRSLPQEDNFQAIGHLAKKVIEDAAIKSLSNYRRAQDGE